MSDLKEGIVNICLSTVGQGPKMFWDEAVAGGWGNPKFPNGNWKPWCAVRASYCVWKASNGTVRLGQGLKAGYRGVYRTGAASVPVLLEWAKRDGAFSPAPAPGMQVLIEVRRPEGWTGVPNHIATCIGLRSNEDGDIVDVICQDGNYGGKDRRVVRPFGKTKGKERMVGFIDCSVFSPSQAEVKEQQLPIPFPVGFDHDDETVLDAVDDADDDLWVQTPESGDGGSRARVVERVGGDLRVQVVADDGQVIMENPALKPDEYTLLGRWE